MLPPLIALSRRPFSLARLGLCIASLLALASCKNTKATSGGDSPYASNDGGYRPYKGAQGGTVQATGHPQYEQAVPPPPPGYELPKDADTTPAPAPKKSTASSSSSSTGKKSTSGGSSTAKKSNASSTPAKRVASSNNDPAPKPKSTSTAAKKKTPSSSGSSAYTVVKGDTLYGLALRKHTTVAKIKAASNLSSDKLSIGQKLRIP